MIKRQQTRSAISTTNEKQSLSRQAFVSNQLYQLWQWLEEGGGEPVFGLTGLITTLLAGAGKPETQSMLASD